MKKPVKLYLVLLTLLALLLAGCASGQDSPPAETPSPTPEVPPTVRINELMPSNKSTLADGDTFPDWIELYNYGGEPALLAGCTLNIGGKSWRCRSWRYGPMHTRWYSAAGRTSLSRCPRQARKSASSARAARRSTASAMKTPSPTSASAVTATVSRRPNIRPPASRTAPTALPRFRRAASAPRPS